MAEFPLYNEKELLLRIVAGDEHAFNTIVRSYWPRLYPVALAYIKMPELAEDVVQEVFMTLWIRRASLNTVNSLKDYLFIMTKHEVLRALRSRSVQDPLNDYLEAMIRDHQHSPVASVAYKQLSEKLAKVIEGLPPQQKRAFLLSREEGLGHEAIAREMNLSVNTVKNHIVSALNTLRNFLLVNKDLLISIFYFFLTSR